MKLNADIFIASIYLAEGCIFYFKLVAKHNSSWMLHYIRSTYAETGVLGTVPEFISQRRCWLNSTFFAVFVLFVVLLPFEEVAIVSF